MNPAREVKIERFSRTEGETPALSEVKPKSFLTRSRHPRTPASAERVLLPQSPTLFIRGTEAANL
jgi:hypothetical protein